MDSMNDRLFTLRPATQADSDAIHGLVHIGGINPTGLDWRRFVVADTQEGQVIGCGQIKPHRDGSFELASIVVHPDWRGQGVARSLIEHLIETHQGDMYLMCRTELGPFYEKFGFRVISITEMPPYFRRINRLVSLVAKLRSEGSGLLVMQRG
jgi:N-acetylglutamate synthase-like GNAT family acetyltransferase